MLQQIAEAVVGQAEVVGALDDGAEGLLGALGLAVDEQDLAAQQLVDRRALLLGRGYQERALGGAGVAGADGVGGHLGERAVARGGGEALAVERSLGLREEVAAVAHAGDALGGGVVAELEVELAQLGGDVRISGASSSARSSAVRACGKSRFMR